MFMIIREGIMNSAINGQSEKSIIDFVFDGYLLTVFQGTLSAYDIIVKYKKLEKGCHLRQPKHSQWAVDILMKIQGDKKRAQQMLTIASEMWKNSIPLKDNQYETLKALIENDDYKVQIECFSQLDKYGEYNVEFLYTLMRLLAAQEKTNYPDAYMFGIVIDQLLKDEIDIYKVLSYASFNGRR